MTTEQEKNRVWYDSVVRPKLQALVELSHHPGSLVDFDDKLFFKELLADLEHLSLDDFTTENDIEKIRAAIEVLRLGHQQGQDFKLRDLALIAMLENIFDRFLFFQKWSHYQNFRRVHTSISDESLLNAFRISHLIKDFAQTIELRAQLIISGQVS